MLMVKIYNVNRKLSRLLAFVFGMIALVTLSLLAISLNTLKFDPGLPLPLQYLLPNFLDLGGSSQIMQVLLPALRVTMILSWILLPFVIIYLILSKQARAQLLKDLAFILPMIIFIYILARVLMNADASQNQANKSNLNGQAALAALHLPPYVLPPNWVTTVAMLLVAGFFAFVILEVVNVFLKDQRHKSRDALAIVRHEIQNTLISIEAGNDLQNAITICYLQMVDAIKENRQISRDQDMTPHEFEGYLEYYGLPHDPVHRLTQLFEKVRYGAWVPNPKDENEAMESLSLIIAACKQPKPG